MRQLLQYTFGLIICTCTHSANALDLSEALKLAQEYDTEFQAAFANYLAVSEASTLATSAALPQVGVNGFLQYGEIKNRSNGTSNTSKNNSDGYSLDLNQVIYDKTVFDTISEGDAITAKALSDLETAKQDTILRVSRAYFDVLITIDTLEAVSADKKAIHKQLVQSQERFNVGLSPITDVREQQASYDVAVANEITAINDLSNRREALRVIINVYPENLKVASEEIPLVIPEPMNIDAWQEKSLQNNFSLRSAKHAVDAAQSAYDASTGQHYPVLSMNASYGVVHTDKRDLNTGGTFPSNKSTDGKVVFNLNIPLYTGGRINSTVRTKASELSLSKALQENEKRRTIALSRSAFLSVKADIAKVKARKQAIFSTRTSLEATIAGYDAGTRTSVDVLLAQKLFFESKRDYSVARYTYLTNSLALKNVAGLLRPRDVEAINKWLIIRVDEDS